MSGLTATQRAAMAAIQAREDATGATPTIRELCDALGVTRAPMHAMLRRLEDRGWIVIRPRRARGIVVLRRIAPLVLWAVRGTDGDVRMGVRP